MAREKKATGDAPKKRTSRSKTPVAAVEVTQQYPENGNSVQTAGGNGSNKNLNPETIRQRAYEIWEQRGRQHGKDADDWYRAESEIRGKSA